MNPFTWNDLRELMDKLSPHSDPVIERIEFHYEQIDTRDAGGVVHTTHLEPIGATVEIRMP